MKSGIDIECSVVSGGRESRTALFRGVPSIPINRAAPAFTLHAYLSFREPERRITYSPDTQTIAIEG